jgi:hypothetical protein
VTDVGASLLTQRGRIALAGVCATIALGCSLVFPLNPLGDGVRPQDGGGSPESSSPQDSGLPVDSSRICDAAACAPTTLYSTPNPMDVIRAVAVDSTHVVWANMSDSTIDEVNLDGTNPSVLLTGVSVSELTIGGAYVYYTGTYDAGTGLFSLDQSGNTSMVSSFGDACVWVVGSSAYVVDRGTNTIAQIDLGTGAETPLLQASSDVTNPWGVATDTSSLYWSDGVSEVGSIWRDPLDGGPATELAMNQRRPQCVAVDDGGAVYWANFDDGTVSEWTVAGGSSTVAQGQTNPTTVVITAQFLYWNSANSIVRLAR